MVGQLIARLVAAEGADSSRRFSVAVTGDHSTPAVFGDHSHEPVPFAAAHIGWALPPPLPVQDHGSTLTELVPHFSFSEILSGDIGKLVLPFFLCYLK